MLKYGCLLFLFPVTGQSVRVDPEADTGRGPVLDFLTELYLQMLGNCEHEARVRFGEGVVVRQARIGVTATEGEMCQHGPDRKESGRVNLWRLTFLQAENLERSG